MALSSLTAVRSAEFSGTISWKTIHTISLRSENTKFVFYIQKPRIFAVIEKSIYKPWRIVMRKKIRCRWVGHVVGEFDRETDAFNALRSIKELFSTGFVEQNAELKHGDVISVPTSMFGIGARHFGIYDAKKKSVIEYQLPAKGSKDIHSSKGSIQATPYIEFQKRVEKEYDSFDLIKHNYLKGKVYEGNKVVQRARSKLGVCNYNVMWRNCESFAVWCKTGNHQTIQAREIATNAIDWSLKLCGVIGAVAIVAGTIYVVAPGAVVTTTITKTTGGFLGWGGTSTTSTAAATVPTAIPATSSTVTTGGFLGIGATTTKTTTAVAAVKTSVVSKGVLVKASGNIYIPSIPLVLGEGCNKKICGTENSKFWECQACTFNENTLQDNKCFVCGFDR
eukprot:129711_1